MILCLLVMSFQYLPKAQEADGDLLLFENRVAHVIASFQNITERPHFLGEEVGRKYSVFNDLYSYTVSGEVFQTGQQVVVDKPTIYNSVKRTNRFYRRLLRRNEISEEEALRKVNHLLDVAISVYTQSTEALENELRKAKKPDEIAEVFNRVVLR